MKEVFEKIIEKLEERRMLHAGLAQSDKLTEQEREVQSRFCGCFYKAKEIVKQEAEQYNNGWIPCGEQLPEAGKRYLVSAIWKDKDFEKSAVYDAVYGSDGLWHSYNYDPVYYKVIAYQPLPKPYQPKGE